MKISLNSRPRIRVHWANTSIVLVFVKPTLKTIHWLERSLKKMYLVSNKIERLILSLMSMIRSIRESIWILWKNQSIINKGLMEATLILI